MALSPSRGDPMTSHAGLWPELALTNHSCLPNALPMVVGDRLVLRWEGDAKVFASPEP